MTYTMFQERAQFSLEEFIRTSIDWPCIFVLKLDFSKQLVIVCPFIQSNISRKHKNNHFYSVYLSIRSIHVLTEKISMMIQTIGFRINQMVAESIKIKYNNGFYITILIINLYLQLWHYVKVKPHSKTIKQYMLQT